MFLCTRSQTNDEMFIVLEKYHQILLYKNMKAALDKSQFFLTRVKFLGHIIERNPITPLKSRIDAIQKFQPPSIKKKTQKFLGMYAILPDWQSATFRRNVKIEVEALMDKNYCKGGSEFSRILNFQNFD